MKNPVEQKLRRMTGMSAAKVEEMHKASAVHPWRARCWSCKTWNEGLQDALKTCKACGKNLWSRDE